MSTTTVARWKDMRTDDSKFVESHLAPHFEQADAYRFNSASIRVRVVDSRFEGKSREQRDDLVEPFLHQLPLEIQRDIVALFTFAPSELDTDSSAWRESYQNREFEDPSPSTL